LGQAGIGDPAGLLLSLSAGACYAIYAMSAKQLLIEGWTPIGSVAVIFGWAAVAAIPILLLSDLSWLARLDGVALALWLGVVTITVATLGLGEPFTATLLGVFVLHETLQGTAIVGLVLVVFGLVLIGVLRARRLAPSAPSLKGLPAP